MVITYGIRNQRGEWWGGMAGTVPGWGPRELRHGWAHYASAFHAARQIGPGAVVVEW